MKFKLLLSTLILLLGSFGHNMFAMQARIAGRIAPRIVAQGKPQIPAQTRLAQKSAPQFCWQMDKKELHYKDIRGIHKQFDNAHKHLSLVLAVPYVETDWMQRLYRFGNAAHPTVQLARSLFHLHETQFRPTQNKSLPGYSLTPELIGLIIAHLENGTFDNPEVREELIKRWLAGALPVKLSNKKVCALLDTIQASVEQCRTENFYLPHTPYFILLGYLYRKYEHRADIDRYIETIKKHLADKEPAKSGLLEQVKKYITTYFSKSAQPEAEASSYTPADFHTSQKLSQHDTYEMAKSDVEKTIFCLASQKTYQTKMPPKVIQASYGYKNQVAKPNCMETALQELMHQILSDGITDQFNLNLLANLHLEPGLVEYFTKFNAFESVNTSAAGQAWMNLVSGHTCLSYDSGNYELTPSFTNFINFFNYFCSIDAKNLDELGKALSDNKKTIVFSLKNPTKDQEVVSVDIKHGFTKHTQLEISFNGHHADAKIIPSEKKAHTRLNHICFDANSRPQRHSDSSRNYQIDYYLPFASSAASTFEVVNNFKHCLFHSIFSTAVEDPNHLTAVIILLINQYTYDGNNITKLDHIINSLIEKLPTATDLNFSYRIAEHIIKKCSPHAFSEGNSNNFEILKPFLQKYPHLINSMYMFYRKWTFNNNDSKNPQLYASPHILINPAKLAELDTRFEEFTKMV